MSDYGRVFHKSNLRRITLRGKEKRSLVPIRLDSTRRKCKTMHVSPELIRSPSYVNGHSITRRRDVTLY